MAEHMIDLTDEDVLAWGHVCARLGWRNTPKVFDGARASDRRDYQLMHFVCQASRDQRQLCDDGAYSDVLAIESDVRKALIWGNITHIA